MGTRGSRLDRELDTALAVETDDADDEELAQRELAECLAELRDDPTEELASYRLRHIPRDTPGHPWSVNRA